MPKSYMEDEIVNQLFKMWIQSPDPMLLNHPADRRVFFKFVKACFGFVGHRPYGSKIDMGIFNKYLTEALIDKKYTKEVIESIRFSSVVLFERLIEYEDTKSSYVAKGYRI